MPAILHHRFAKVSFFTLRKATQLKPAAKADKKAALSFLDYLRIALSGGAA
jgi:hypothetical protein